MKNRKNSYPKRMISPILPPETTDYLESLVLKGETRQTFTQNRRHLWLFTDYLAQRHPHSVGYREAQGFIIWLSENYPDYSAGYTLNIIKSIRRFYRREKELGRVAEDPFLYTRTPRVPRILPRNVPKDREIRTLIDAIPRTNYRDRAIVELLYGSGIRAGELLSLKTDAIDLEPGEARVIDSKNKTERIVPLNDMTLYCLKDYIKIERPAILLSKPLQERKPEMRKPAKDRLFLKRGGFPLCTWMLSEIIEFYRKKAGLKDRLTPHSFRHSFATEMLKGGASIRYIQVLLGHDDISTTMIYTKLGVDELKEKLDKVHPHGVKT